MGEILLRQAYRKHSIFSLWSQWTGLKQLPGESSQKYCNRARDLQSQESISDKWAVAALLKGIREPMRVRFYN